MCVIGAIVVAAVGILCLILGYLLWKKEMISLLHDYHYEKVSAEDKQAFCALSGLGLMIVGGGLVLTAVLLAITESVWSFIPFVIGMVAGIALLVYAGKKYNV